MKDRYSPCEVPARYCSPQAAYWEESHEGRWLELPWPWDRVVHCRFCGQRVTILNCHTIAFKLVQEEP